LNPAADRLRHITGSLQISYPAQIVLIVVTPPHSVQYEIEVQNDYTCTAKANTRINTFSPGRVNIPNAFLRTVTGTMIFYIMGGQEVKMIKEFSIFNRWGSPFLQNKYSGQ
jgi:hypothetical protein